jgi:hypothetical protein
LTQNPKVKIGKVFAAGVRKSRIHPTVKNSPLGKRPIGYLNPRSWDPAYSNYSVVDTSYTIAHYEGDILCATVF